MNVALITAGGIGSRLGASIPKQFVEVLGKPIIIYTLELFDKLEDIDAIVVTCVESYIPKLWKLIRSYQLSKVRSVVIGGSTGQQSIFQGLLEISTFCPSDTMVLIHDSVRPLVMEKTIQENINNANKGLSSVTCVPMTETLLRIEANGKLQTPSRRNSYIARAPQTFRLCDLLCAHNKAIVEGIFDFVDSCTLMLHYDYRFCIVEGSRENIKITTPSDLFTFKALIQKRESEEFLSI